MTAFQPTHAPSPLAPLVDEQRLGSAGGQALVGVAGIVLAIILVVGQLSLATTKGIAAHLDTAVGNLTEGNKVMESVVERAAPSTELEKVLATQSKTLANTRDALVTMNSELQAIDGSTRSLLDVVGEMRTTSTGLATSVSRVDSTTGDMTRMLGTLPKATTRTQGELTRINRDMTAINGELGAISGKMRTYGLPRAKGAPTG